MLVCQFFLACDNLMIVINQYREGWSENFFGTFLTRIVSSDEEVSLTAALEFYSSVGSL